MLMKGKFKPPTTQDSLKAIGDLSQKSPTSQHLQTIIKLFNPVKAPSTEDWLASHNEKGESFPSYQKRHKNLFSKSKNTIYIQPLEKEIPTRFLERLQEYLQAFFFNGNVKMLNWENVFEKFAIRSRVNDYSLRKQYNSRDLLKYLVKLLPKDAYCLIGVLFTDLYPEESWNYVFGQASLVDRTGVFSFARYDDRFFKDGEYKIQEENEIVFFRSCQVSSHEIGHMFGLHHCIFFDCKMNGSNHLEESISRATQFCPVCLRKLQYNLKFDILERYKALYTFASQQKLKEWQIVAEEYLRIIKQIENNGESKQQTKIKENFIQSQQQQYLGNSEMEKALYTVQSVKCQYDSLN